MSKRKTQIDRAVEQLDAKKAELTRKYEAEVAGINAAIETLRSQPVRKPRKARAATA